MLNGKAKPMALNTKRLMGVAEAIACVTLAGMCIAMAVGGHAIAWLYGFGSLSFAWDLRRRLGETKAGSDQTTQHER